MDSSAMDTYRRLPVQERLAERLCELSGPDNVFIGKSGAEVNEAAIRICSRYAHEKNVHDPVIVITYGSVHGWTMATLTATGNDKVKEVFDSQGTGGA